LKIIIIIIAILSTFVIFSTFFHDTVLVGDIGKSIGQTNLYLFGYLAYINIIILFYPLYRLYSDVKTRDDIEFYLGWTLLYIAFVLLFALVVDEQNVGLIGTQIVDTLLPLIGKFGLWLFLIMIVALALLFILDDDFEPDFDFDLWIYRVQKFWSSLSFDGVKSIFGAILSIFKSISRAIFKNHFASPIDSEFMPHIDTKPKKRVKKQPKREEPEEIDDPIIEEITQLERETFVDSKPVEIVDRLEENAKLMEDMDRGEVSKPNNFKLPKLEFLQKAPKAKRRINEEEIDRKIEELLSKLKHFKVDGDVVRTYSGPLVTTFEFKPAPNVKISRILNLQDDLAMALSAKTVRIQAPIPGRDVMGIEIPNETIETIYLREILESEIFRKSSSPLTVALGKDIVGNPFITDLKKLPHLLIAGTTGSGKSVGINSMILSLLYRNDPDQLKLMLIDPKMLEFSIYNDIPHLLTPVIIEPKKAIAALANMVLEMERRYKLMAENRTKNIDNYNDKVKKDGSAEPFPFIVIVIDELADLMMNGGKEVEYSIARLAQMARASGIHLVVATQRPSVDVVTGLIKANLPSRLSYRVGQRIDSKVILDTMGAESLLGRGDGLFTPPGSVGLVRIHAPWNKEEEVEEVVEFIKAQREPDYDESYLISGDGGTVEESGIGQMSLDPLYEDAKAVVLSDNKTSISYLQRKLQIGYNRSANIIEQLESTGVLSAPNAKGNRDIL